MSGKHLMLAVIAILGSGCVEDSGVFVILQNQIPEEGEGCVVPVARTTEFRAMGVLDVALDRPRGYHLFPYIENRIKDNAETKTANTIKVDRYRVEITPDPRLAPPVFGGGCLLDFSQLLSLQIEPAGSVSGLVEVMLPCHAQIIRDAFVQGSYRGHSDQLQEIYYSVKLRLVGKRGGSTIESDPFYYPIRVCYGCLQLGAPDRIITPLCSETPAINPYKGNPCNIAQDEGPFMCCYEKVPQGGMLLICPAPDRGVEAEK